MIIREMTIEDFDDVITLWQSCEGIGLHDISDSRESITDYLLRNPGFSQVAVVDGQLLGTILAGHDGRRGALYHLAVDPERRGMGIARALVKKALTLLESQGILKSHIMVYRDNHNGKRFWKAVSAGTCGMILI